MTSLSTQTVQKDSDVLRQLFSWLFGFGVFLVFSEIAYIPLKAIFFSFGTTELASAVSDFAETAIAALPVLALLGAVWQARRVFTSFASGHILTVEAGKALGRLGDWLVISSVLMFFVGPADDRHTAVFGLYVSTIIMLGSVGLAIRLVGRVIEVAAAIKSEHDQIV